MTTYYRLRRHIQLLLLQLSWLIDRELDVRVHALSDLVICVSTLSQHMLKLGRTCLERHIRVWEQSPSTDGTDHSEG